MARTPRKGTHRSKKKRITLALAPVAALAVAVPLMNSAGAATPDEVAADCRADSDKLENCEFVPVGVRHNSLGPNKVVSDVTDNCGKDTPKGTGFSVTGSVTRTVQTDSGFSAGGDSKLANSFFEIGIKFSTTEFNVKRDDTKTGFSYSIDDEVKPDHVGVFMWSEKRTDVSGYLKATYKDEQDGQKVFFSPREGATDIHVFYPQLLKNGTPDGRLWMRNVKCGTPEADRLLNKA
ncbi:hypothetical protein [Streptomyces viridochromogenes]|uniref:hypothetical protein n=1 Tax=Streptomyces viridochromogenes TaxID=1938 RepID=UPI000AF3B1E4|nr:hypothetical protein [Streptomyces viridochromogenes]